AVLTQARLRQKARGKFGDFAARMLFTEAVAQARLLLEELRSKRDNLVARSKTAEAQSKVNDALGNIDVLDPTSDLGLPELPTGSGGSSLEGNASDALGLLTSSHTARVYVDGADKQRVQLTQRLAEQDLVRNGSEVWTWDSKERTATHVVLPKDAATPKSGTATPNDASRAAATPRPTTRSAPPSGSCTAG
ncbi:hypothetical protein IAE22_27935, partial [Bacillus sp. S34]|nr:hypothetical protein [Bacillus sp. S34]